MKILMIFADMLRPDRFNIYNQMIEPNAMDHLIKDLGGDLYKNCFTPAPDTPRSMASFYTGLSPLENNCNSRVKWPGKFLDSSQATLFDPFINNNYAMHFFSNPNERSGGLFPPGIENIGIHNNDYRLDNYLNSIALKKDHLLFVSLPDYHWALQDWGYTKKAEKVAVNEIKKSIDIIFQEFNKDDFDHIFIFSDHGFKFNYQMKIEEHFQFINRDRSNIFLLHREKGNNSINYKDKLCSIQDLTHTINDLFDLDNEYSLLRENEREYVVIEDHLSISAPQVNQSVDIWGVATKNEIYVRTLNNGFIIKDDKICEQKLDPDYDDILINETQFGRYFDEHQKVSSYNELILAQTDFMNGRPRPEENLNHKLIKYIEIIKDRTGAYLNKLIKKS
jgi:hypothetical protein